jgi:hypothetical protein
LFLETCPGLTNKEKLSTDFKEVKLRYSGMRKETGTMVGKFSGKGNSKYPNFEVENISGS